VRGRRAGGACTIGRIFELKFTVGPFSRSEIAHTAPTSAVVVAWTVATALSVQWIRVNRSVRRQRAAGQSRVSHSLRRIAYIH
jgi:hypothetical protein